MDLDLVPQNLLKYLRFQFKNKDIEYNTPPTRYGAGISNYIYKLQLKMVISVDHAINGVYGIISPILIFILISFPIGSPFFG